MIFMTRPNAFETFVFWLEYRRGKRERTNERGEETHATRSFFVATGPFLFFITLGFGRGKVFYGDQEAKNNEYFKMHIATFFPPLFCAQRRTAALLGFKSEEIVFYKLTT